MEDESRAPVNLERPEMQPELRTDSNLKLINVLTTLWALIITLIRVRRVHSAPMWFSSTNSYLDTEKRHSMFHSNKFFGVKPVLVIM